MEPIIEVAGLTKNFGGIRAVSDVSFCVTPGQIKSIIGPNGAGKTTLFNMISGVLAPTAGKMLFKGKSLLRLKPYQIAALGISRTFQNIQLFGNMSVLENVMVGRHIRTNSGALSAAFRLPRARAEERAIAESAMEKLDFVGLASYAERPAPSLPIGQQRALEFARALATEPELLLLDEPAAGLNAYEAGLLAELVTKMGDTGITVLLVEHNMELVMDIAQEIIVLNYGEKIAEGLPEEIQSNEQVILAYLGEEA